MISPALPAGLAAAIAAQLERRPRQTLGESARRLSESYRSHKPSSDAIRDETDALAYALTRMPATYAAVAAVFGRLADEQPDFAPRSLLDAGCGLGAAAYAAVSVWPGIAQVEMLDHSRAFLDLAARLATESESVVSGASIAAADLTRLPEPKSTSDLVVVAYALTELADADLPGVAQSLWARSGAALAIIEPGTPRDYKRLMGLRALLADSGAKILAPCPHAGPCLLEAPDWCHFSVRLPRSREHRSLKAADAPYEDEKFSYLVAARDGAGAGARLLSHPRHSKAGVTAKLCAPNGLNEIFLPKRDKARYEGVRRKNWGDALEAFPEDAG